MLAVAAMVAVRLALDPALGDGSPFLLFTPAVMLAAWYGGVWPGLLATLLSAGVGLRFLGAARHPLTLDELDRLTLFLVVGAAVTWLQVRVRAAAERIRTLLKSEQAARAEVEAANRAKDEFLAAVSHELRTPLSVILGWSAILEDHVDEPDAIRKAAAVISRNAKVQQRLVEDLLDSVRATRGTMRLRRERVDLASVVTAATDASRPAAFERGVALRLHVQPGDCSVWGDAARLQQVLMNLLSNATKFTSRNGVVDVGLQYTAGSARVSVSDTGEGIDAQFLPHVFEPFRKGHDSSAGLGLGLSIVRHIVSMHGGSVTAASPGRGGGTVFVITLPLLLANSALPAEGLDPGLQASA